MGGIKNIVFSSRLGKPLEVDICAVPSWDDFDKLIQFLKNEYAVKIVECVDGPDSRRWVLKAKGQVFELIHDDPYGNSLVAPTPDSESIVREIGSDLETRLSNL